MISQRLKDLLLFPMNVLYKISPKFELKVMFRLKQGYKLDLKNPKTFNEKLQWMKLYWDSPVREICSDKYCVRDYVKEKCPEILTKLYWQGCDPSQIPFDELPEKFVLKVTCGSGYNIICKNKSQLNYKKTREKLKKWLTKKYLPCYGEEFYGKIKPSIIAEEYLDAKDGLVDYKVLCFDGKAKYIWCAFDRFSNLGPQGVVLNTDWEYIEGVYMSYPLRNVEKIPPRPKMLSKLIEYAEILSNNLPHVRVDMYIVGDRIVFGEMSFSHGAGFDKIMPYTFDKELGDMFNLPK